MSVGPYIKAIDDHLRLIKLLRQDAKPKSISPAHWQELMLTHKLDGVGRQMLTDRFITDLLKSSTFYMDRHFCDLVDHANDQVPTDLCFESQWLQTPMGFMTLEHGPKNLEAVFWKLTGDRIEMRLMLRKWMAAQESALIFSEHSIRADQSLSSVDLNATQREELRWIYCAFHLMAQPLACVVQQKPDRSARRRAEREGECVPDIVQVITLRRLEADRAKAGDSASAREWKWQWAVRGHWRHQYYRSDDCHRWIFIEAYVKGPTDKPFKSGLKVFGVVR